MNNYERLGMKPIIFNSENVRAILEGRKTQTRAMKNLDIINKKPDYFAFIGVNDNPTYAPNLYRFAKKSKGTTYLIKCPYGQVGDRLWVQEAVSGDHYFGYIYKADGITHHPKHKDKLYWKYAKQMPKCASRITLEITDVRVERVCKISEEDCQKEGVKSRKEFEELWNKIHKKEDKFIQSPWVWVLTYKQV